MIKTTNKGNAFWANRLWALDQHTLTRMMAAVGPMPSQQAPAPPSTGYEVNSGVAVIPVVGPMSKYDDVFMAIFGGVSTVDLQNKLASANSNKDVTAILLYIDSPGGSVSGVVDLADAIYASEKRVYAYISDCGNSGAYWIASQCDKVWINRAGYAGSVGVYTTVTDYTKAFDDEGLKVNLVRAGEYKGGGEPGTPITAEVLAETQKLVDGIYKLFVEQVATGRGLSIERVKAFADGQTYIASEALSLGLVDAILSSDDIIKQIMNEQGENNMADENITPVLDPVAPVEAAPVDEQAKAEADTVDQYAKGKAEEQARFEAVVSACKGDIDFAVKCYRDGQDATAAKLSYADKAIQESEAMAKEIVKLKASSMSGGADPVALAASAVGGSPIMSSSDDVIQASWNANKDNCREVHKNDFKAYAALTRYEARKGNRVR